MHPLNVYTCTCKRIWQNTVPKTLAQVYGAGHIIPVYSTMLLVQCAVPTQCEQSIYTIVAVASDSSVFTYMYMYTGLLTSYTYVYMYV